MAQAARAAAFAGSVRDALAPLGVDGKPAYTPGAAYPVSPEAFPRRLAGFAAMLAAGLPIRAASISAPGGYDTHANQAESLPKNLKLTFDSLLAFQRDLEARGIADRVLTLVWSEFGRRAAENGSGTDHGAAGVGFLIGARAAGRMVGEFPGLAKLDRDGNLRATSDYRGVYGALCGDWFGVDPLRDPARRARDRKAGDPQVRWLIVLAVVFGALAAPAQAAAPSRLLVEATEFRFTLSRTTVKAGPAIVQLAVRGEDPHDLRLVPARGRGRAAAQPASSRRRCRGP